MDLVMYDAYKKQFFNYESVLDASGLYASGASTIINSLMIAGNGGTSSAQVTIFTPGQGSVSTMTLSQARSNLAVTSVGNQVVFAGGQGETSISALVDIYCVSSDINSTTPNWTTAQLSVPRQKITAITLGNTALFAGGVDATGQPMLVIDLYTV